MTAKVVNRILGERLKAARAAAGKSQPELARLVDMRQSAIAEIEAGRVKRPKKLREIAAAVQTSEAFLLGETEDPAPVGLTYAPFPDETPPDWQPEFGRVIKLRAYDRDNYKPTVPGALPEVDVSTGAGEGRVGDVISLNMGRETYSGHAVVAEWLMPPEYLRNEARVAPNRTIVMSVVGDSMIPTYQPGDRVLVDLTQNRLMQDTVYVISDGQSPPQIKRLTRVLFTDPVQVRVISDNGAHGEQTVELDRLSIIGRVCGVVARR